MTTLSPASDIKKMSIEELLNELNIKKMTDEEIEEERIRRQLIQKVNVKRYYLNNKEKILEKKKELRDKDPEGFKIRQANYQKSHRQLLDYKIQCECGIQLKKISHRVHLLSNNHQKRMERLKDEIVDS